MIASPTASNMVAAIMNANVFIIASECSHGLLLAGNRNRHGDEGGSSCLLLWLGCREGARRRSDLLRARASRRRRRFCWHREEFLRWLPSSPLPDSILCWEYLPAFVLQLRVARF